MQESREGGSPLVPVMLLASFAAIAVGSRNAPFQLTRPVFAEERVDVNEGASAAERRLWDDPLLGVPACPLGPPAPPGPGEAKAICVMLQAGNTSDARESRRRTRYAVHAAMTAEGYKPVDPELLRYLACYARGVQAPYEDFAIAPEIADPASNPPKGIRVFWVDERSFSERGEPPGAGLLRNLHEAITGDVPLVVIGPTTSNVFANMSRGFAADQCSDTTIYSPWATRYDDEWRAATSASRSWGSLQVKRMIADDRAVAESLVRELSERGIGSGSVPVQTAPASVQSRVLLVIERDSDFARAWKGYLESAWQVVFNRTWPCGVLPRFEVAYFSRGLDGNTVGSATQASTPSIETPEGRATLDYLRRLCAHIASRKIVAVGVFAQDVHDKLLVLQALRPMMGEAVFFTNDLDSYFGHPATAKYTRNLVVASDYSLLPGCASDHHVTPFRNQYQTATFEAVKAAIAADVVPKGKASNGDFSGGGKAGADDAVAKRRQRMRLFEIGSSGAVELPRSAGTSPLAWYYTLLVGLVTVGAIVGALLIVRRIRAKAVVPPLHGLPVLHWSLMFAFLLPPLLVVAVTCAFGSDAWTTEPFALFDGISVWPTEMLRATSYYLSLVFGFVLLCRLRSDYATIEKRFIGATALWHVRLRFRALGSRFDRVVERVCWLGRNCARPRCNAGWWLGRFVSRRMQALFGQPRVEMHAASAFVVAILFFVSMFALMRVTGLPHSPARGDLARTVDFCVMVGSVLAMLWMLFLVAGTSLRMAYAIRRLRTHPIQLREPLPKRFGPADADVVVRLRLLEAIANFGGHCIYGPFVVILVLILSRWRGFDDWSWPPLLVGVIAFSIVLAMSSAFVLTAVARAYRRDTVRMIDRRVRDDIDATEEDRSRSLERLRREIVAIDTGIFAGLSGHPAVRALLIPAGGLGGLSLVPLLT